MHFQYPASHRRSAVCASLPCLQKASSECSGLAHCSASQITRVTRLLRFAHSCCAVCPTARGDVARSENASWLAAAAGFCGAGCTAGLLSCSVAAPSRLSAVRDGAAACDLAPVFVSASAATLASSFARALSAWIRILSACSRASSSHLRSRWSSRSLRLRSLSVLCFSDSKRASARCRASALRFAAQTEYAIPPTRRTTRIVTAAVARICNWCSADLHFAQNPGLKLGTATVAEVL